MRAQPRVHRSGFLANTAALSLVLMACAFSACASTRYAYIPVKAATLTSAELARGPVGVTRPVDEGQGSVSVAVLGEAEISSVAGPKAKRVPALHLRMVVNNGTTRTWSVNGAEQRIELAEAHDRVAVYAMTPEGGRAPLMDILGRRATTLDLYFPFLPGQKGASDLPRFDVVWSVRVGDRVVSERVPFERVVATPPTTEDRQAPGSYFSDPFNAEGTFWQPPDAIGYPPDNRPPSFPNPR